MKLLNKEEIKRPTLTPNEKISINMAFRNKEIKLNVIPKKTRLITPNPDDPNRPQGPDDGIKKERKAICDAHIVKQMKSNLAGMHMKDELIPKVMESIKNFRAQPPMIKKRIDHLIGQDYMKRDEKIKAILIYIP